MATKYVNMQITEQCRDNLRLLKDLSSESRRESMSACVSRLVLAELTKKYEAGSSILIDGKMHRLEIVESNEPASEDTEVT